MTPTPHLGFIVAAYAVATMTILTMVVAIVWDYRALVGKLRDLEGAPAEAGEGIEP